MLKRIFNEFRNSVDRLREKNNDIFHEKLESFRDSLAKGISWGPKVKGGSKLRTRTMIKSGYSLIRFVPAFGPLVISVLLCVGGLWVMSFITPNISITQYLFNFVGIIQLIYFKVQHNPAMLGVLLFAFVFLMMGFISLYLLFKPIRFDRDKRLFVAGYAFSKTKTISFDDIKAVQIISEHCLKTNHNSTHKTSYLSYELNLVLKDKSRVNVVDHSDVDEIKRGADAISKMMLVPVWDLSEV
jgi:hypothetical protein